MFNYVSIEFPLSQNPPQRLLSFTMRQERYAHETATVRFRDWSVQYTSVRPGDPVRCKLSGVGNTKEFVGYVHAVKPRLSPGNAFVELTLIGASYRLKQARQRVFENITADKVIENIAKEYGFNAYTSAHPRIYEQITQAGISELQMMSRLAKQCGYSLRIENTSIHFHPFTYDYTNANALANTFFMRDANSPAGSNLYEFNLTVGDSVAYRDSYKSAVQVGGVDPYNTQPNIVTNKREDTLRETTAVEFFDSFDTNTVAPGFGVSAYEAKAADERNRFPYRATVKVLGTPTVRPDSPVYLNGIGPEYSGYWIVLAAQHDVIEQGKNILKYTTTLEVGTDSIGKASVWRGKDVGSPTDSGVRFLVPDTRNVADTNSSVLVPGTGVYFNSFGEVTNRDTPSNVKPYVWASVAPIDSPNNTAKNNRSQVVYQRLESKGAI